MTGHGGRRRLSTIALRVLTFLILVLLAMMVMVAQQRGAGAYVADLSATDPAEARHFVTGLMLADLLAARPADPAAFAADYAARLPAALPFAQVTLFHVAEAGWLSLLPPTPPAALLLPALCAALLLVTAGWAAARAIGPLPGVAVGFVLSAVPPVRAASLIVGPGLPLALAALCVALACARLARSGRPADAALLVAAGALAILLAPAGALVLLVPPLAALLSGRPGLMGRAGFWMPLALWAGLVAAMAAWSGTRPGALDGAALAAAFAELRAAFGLLPLGLAAAGLLFTLGSGRRGAVEAGIDTGEMDTAAMAPVAALAVATCFALLLGMPAEAGALVLSAPAAMLAAFGAIRLIGLVTSGWTLLSGLAVALLLLTSAMPALLGPLRKGVIGMEAAAEAVLARSLVAAPAPPVIVVAADAGGVAALAAAVARQDRAGRIFVVDAARLPAAEPKAFLAGLDEIGAAAFVLGSVPDGPARAAPAAFPDRFRLIGTFPRADGRGAVELYGVTRSNPGPADPLATMRRLAAPKP